jgi:hypothetical protein
LINSDRPALAEAQLGVYRLLRQRMLLRHEAEVLPYLDLAAALLAICLDLLDQGEDGLAHGPFRGAVLALEEAGRILSEGDRYRDRPRQRLVHHHRRRRLRLVPRPPPATRRLTTSGPGGGPGPFLRLPHPPRPDKVTNVPTTPELLRLVSAWAAAQLPGERVECVAVRFVGLRRPLVMPIPAVSLTPAAPPFEPYEMQDAILEALDGKALRTDELAKVAGYERRKLFKKPGGLAQLQEQGLVVNDPARGYYRPDAMPTSGEGE